jgi:heme/copper-type cytochrome/quinol oxidase subunit 2
MYGSKKLKILWTFIAIIGVLAMIFFTMMPLLQ